MFYDAIKGLWYNVLIKRQEADMGLWFFLFFLSVVILTQNQSAMRV